MKKILAPLLLCACCLAACAAEKGGVEKFRFRHGGYERAYLVYSPPGLDRTKKYPLLVILHGGGGDGIGMRMLTGHCFERRADKLGAIVAYPDALEKNWNDYRGDPGRKAQRENIDDAAFLEAMAAEISAKYPVDAARVYAAGISNGAMMSYTLACRASGTFAAVAAVAGSMPENLVPACSPPRPVPVMIINGTEDKLVHWSGGEVTGPFGRRKFGRVIPVEKTRDFWLEKDRCDRAKVAASKKDVSEKDGTSLERETYSACAGGAAVDFVKVAGGGHTWPGGAQYLPRFVIGRTSDEMAASDEIWDFFMAHPMPVKK